MHGLVHGRVETVTGRPEWLQTLGPQCGHQFVRDGLEHPGQVTVLLGSLNVVDHCE